MASSRHGTIRVWPETRKLLRKHMVDGAKITGGYRGYNEAPTIDIGFAMLRRGQEPLTQ